MVIWKEVWFFLKIIILGLFCLATTPILSIEHSQIDSLPMGRPKVALVLSGGGAKGFAHIGVLKVLEQEGIPVDIIVGTSIGSLVGGIYSIGYSADEIENIVKSMNWDATLSDDVPRLFQAKYLQELKQRYVLSLPLSERIQPTLPGGMMNGQNVLNVFCGLMGEVPYDADFAEFPIAFACVAADLETGEEVVISNGFLPTALYSSMAIPIAFEPCLRENRLLVDGGVVNNFPTDVAKKMGADIIIGVDIRNDSFTKEELKSIPNVVGRLIGFFDREKLQVNNSYCDVIIKPNISGFSMSSFSRLAADTLIHRGQEAARLHVEELQRIKHRFNLNSNAPALDFHNTESWHIEQIVFHGTHHLNPEFLNKTFGLELPGNYDAAGVKEGIDRIYGLGGFKKVYYYLQNEGDSKTLHIELQTERVSSLNVGFRVNSSDAAALLLNMTQRNYKNVFGLVSFNGELSVNPRLDITIESNRTRFPTVGVNMSGKFQNMNVYDDDDKLFKSNVFSSSGSLYFYQTLSNQYVFGIGVQSEYFSGDMFSKRDTLMSGSNNLDVFLSNAYTYVSFDNQDDFYFPTKGTSATAKFSIIGDWGDQKGICPIVHYKMKNVFPAGRRNALLFDVYARGVMGKNYTEVKSTLVGGEPYSQYFDYHFPFVGLPAVNVGERYVYIASLGMRFRLSENHFFTIIGNSLLQDSSWKLNDDARLIYGGGVRYSLKTRLGPLEATLGYSNVVSKPTISANFGYWF